MVTDTGERTRLPQKIRVALVDTLVDDDTLALLAQRSSLAGIRFRLEYALTTLIRRARKTPTHGTLCALVITVSGLADMVDDADARCRDVEGYLATCTRDIGGGARSVRVCWESYIGGQQSLGIVGEQTVKALDECGVEVDVYPWNLSQVLRKQLFASDAEAEKAGYKWGAGALDMVDPGVRRLVRASPDAPERQQAPGYVGVTWGWAERFGATPWRYARAVAGYCYYDYTELRVRERDLCNSMDAVFVPSEFVRHNMLANGIVAPVHVWSHGVDVALFHERSREGRSSVFRFLFAGVAQPRKGIMECISAFRLAFPNAADVRLRIKSADWGEICDWRRDARDERIEWQYENVSREQMRDILWDADCLIVASRAESFCLPALEALACGVPVVYLSHGGLLDFCDARVGYPVAVKRLAPVMDSLSARLQGYASTPLWALPDMEAFVEVLRHVYQHPEEARRKGLAGAQRAKGWTWRRGVERVIPVLEDL